MLLKASEAKKVENGSSCVVWEYDFPHQHFSFATASIHGRYPQEGMVMNEECEELYYVLSGSGTIHSQKGDFALITGDAYHFEKSEGFWVEGDDLRLALLNIPKWTPEQHVRVENVQM